MRKSRIVKVNQEKTTNLGLELGGERSDVELHAVTHRYHVLLSGFGVRTGTWMGQGWVA